MRVNVEYIKSLKGKRKITAVTAYDYATALLVDEVGIDIILVGDSGGMVMLGYKNTIPVSMKEMLIFCKAVSRARNNAMIVADMPFMSYHINESLTLKNALSFIKYGGADAVKLEGGKEVSDKIKKLVDLGIPVMAHIGLKPQTSTLWQGYKVQGTTKEKALLLLEEAKTLEKAGAFAIVLEQVTYEVAKLITEELTIPTIGIGSGNACDGQVVVIHDILGLYEKFKPRFVKRYAELANEIKSAIKSYIDDVVNSKFPGEEHTFHMDKEEYRKLLEELKNE